MSDFQQAKLWLVDLFGLSKDALHIHFGLALFFLVAMFFRLPLRDWRPVTAVIAAAAAGEIWDFYDTWVAGERLRWDKSWRDIWSTAFWPTVLYLLARYSRLYTR